jgi:hypothetical protein
MLCLISGINGAVRIVTIAQHNELGLWHFSEIWFSLLDSEVKPGAQGFKADINIKSNSASKQQINELYEIGKKLSPAFDTLTNGTSVIAVNS